MARRITPSRSFEANAFLRALDPQDVGLLEPFLEEIQCRMGDKLDGGRRAARKVVFPISLVVSVGLRSHERVVGLVGREGLLGWSALLEGSPRPQQATVLLDGGSAFAIPVERMREACSLSPTLALSLLRFVSSYIDQMSLTASAGSCTTLRERLAAWLLMLHDRIEDDFIRITHRLLASQLGVRRASVTDMLHVLEGESAVQCDRNVIFVRDRGRLETVAAGAYAEAAGTEHYPPPSAPVPTPVSGARMAL